MPIKKSNDEVTIQKNLGGILTGVGHILEKLNELAHSTSNFSEQNKLSNNTLGKELKCVFGYNVKFGLNDSIQVEPFGNIHTEKKSGKASVEEVSEPVVDIFEEVDRTLIVAELPGIASRHVTLDINGDILIINAKNKFKKYHKEILLPRNYTDKQIKIESCNNGILEINCLNSISD